MNSDRDRALLLLRRIERESAYASLLLQNETGFVRTLVLGVLRWRSLLDFHITTLTGRRIGKLDAAVVEVLRIGLYQLLFTDVAKYAAVSETVDMAARHAGRARGLVNAVLRRAAKGELKEPADVATRTAHPEWLIERWTRAFGADRAARMAAADQELSYPDVLQLGDEPPPGGEPSTLVPRVWRLRESTASLSREQFYPLDEGSAVIAAIAAAAGGEVLDLAAAPGSKATYLRAAGVPTISNDVSLTRLRPLLGRDPRVVVSDGRRPPFRRRFRTVLLDAPCSATGTIRKSPELKWRLRESDLATFAILQRELLTSALELADETVIYSTCSLEPEENDAVIDEVLSARRDFERIDLTALAPSGARSWVENGVLRLTPDSGADGFTAFALRRR